jgi:hypothetical protein
MLFASKSLGTTMVDLFEKNNYEKTYIRNFYKKRKEVWKAMLPDGPPPVPKHKYFKKINKTENHFSVFYNPILRNRHAAQYSLWLFKSTLPNNYLKKN